MNERFYLIILALIVLGLALVRHDVTVVAAAPNSVTSPQEGTSGSNETGILNDWSAKIPADTNKTNGKRSGRK